MSLTLPPLLAYPEKTWRRPGPLDRCATMLAASVFARATNWRTSQLTPILAAVDRLAPSLRGLTDRGLREAALTAGQASRADPAAVDQVAGVLAPVCEAVARVIGQRPFAPQMLAAHGCVRGLMIEMATGEGKTLAASLAATTIALAGTPVHLLTVNRYLAERDAAFAAPLYDFFGLSCGLVTEAVGADARRPC